MRKRRNERDSRKRVERVGTRLPTGSADKGEEREKERGGAEGQNVEEHREGSE